MRRYFEIDGRCQVVSRFFLASLSTTLTIGDEAATSGSALTLKRGASGKPFFTWAFMASGEAIQAIASNARRMRAGGRLFGMHNRKPPIGLEESPLGPRGWGRYFTFRLTIEPTSYSNRAAV